jgi:hypothetical protein
MHAFAKRRGDNWKVDADLWGSAPDLCQSKRFFMRMVKQSVTPQSFSKPIDLILFTVYWLAYLRESLHKTMLLWTFP